MSEKARIGIIGCGRIARDGHLPYLKAHKNAEVVAAMDLNDKNRESVCKHFEIPAGYTSPQEMFDKEALDGVLICTPNWVHRDLTLMAASHGAHVLCEKPMARNATECAEMIAACKKAGVKLQIGMVKRFDEGFVKAKKMIMSGKLGKVSHMTASALNPPPPRLDSGMVEMVKKWGELLGRNLLEEMGLWRMTDERTGGGQMLEMGTHLMDFLLFLADEMPCEWGGFVLKNRPDMVWEDQGSVVMKFPSGLTATVELSMNVTADNLIGEHAHVYGGKSSLWINHVHGMWFGIPLYKFIATQVRMYNALSPFTGIGMPVPVAAHPGIYMHKRQIEYFIDGILGRDRDYFGFGPDFAASGEDGLALIKIIDDIYAADRKTKPEKKTAAKKPAEKKKTAATKTAIKKASKNPA